MSSEYYAIALCFVSLHYHIYLNIHKFYSSVTPYLHYYRKHTILRLCKFVRQSACQTSSNEKIDLCEANFYVAKWAISFGMLKIVQQNTDIYNIVYNIYYTNGLKPKHWSSVHLLSLVVGLLYFEITIWRFA